MLYNRKPFLFLVALFFAIDSMAQAGSDEGGFMRSEGKIYVVMAVCATILAGLLLYLVRLERKLNKLEKGDHN